MNKKIGQWVFVILIICGLLLIVFLFMRALSLPEEERNMNAVHVVVRSIEKFVETRGRYPKSLEEVELKDNSFAKKGKDYWGYGIVYIINEKENVLIIGSYGKDNRPGGKGEASDVLIQCILSPLDKLIFDLETGRLRKTNKEGQQMKK